MKSESGCVITVATLGPGEFFGEVSLLTCESRSASVAAQIETEVVVVDKPDFAVRRGWMGVEPTAARSARPASDFEDRGSHRATTTPVPAIILAIGGMVNWSTGQLGNWLIGCFAWLPVDQSLITNPQSPLSVLQIA